MILPSVALPEYYVCCVQYLHDVGCPLNCPSLSTYTPSAYMRPVTDMFLADSSFEGYWIILIHRDDFGSL